MRTKPKDTSIAVIANTTVTVSIKGQKFTLTKEEYDKQRQDQFPRKPHYPDPWDVPRWPHVTWTTTDAAPTLDYSKFPPGTLIR